MFESVKYLTKMELNALLKSITSDRDRLMVLLAYRKALRVTEVVSITLDQLDLKYKLFQAKRVKSSINREYQLYDDEIRLIKKVLKQRKGNSDYLFESQKKGQLDRSYVTRLFKNYCLKIGISPEKAHFHILKHSIGTHLADSPISDRKLQLHMGHKEYRNTQIYTHMNPNSSEQEVSNAKNAGYII